MIVHNSDGSDAATRRNEGLRLINEIYGTGADGAKRRTRLELILKLDILKDIGADPPIILRAPRTNQLFSRAIRQLTAYDVIPNHPMVLEVQKKNMIDESNVSKIPISFLQTLLPSEYKRHLNKGRDPIDPRVYLIYQNKLPHVTRGFHESGYSPNETCGAAVEEILTAASYFDPAGRKKLGESNVSIDTNLAYSIGGNPGAGNPYYDVLALMGFGSALKTFGVDALRQNGSLAVNLTGAAGKGFLNTHSEINRDFNCIGGDNMSISNPVKNQYLIDNSGNSADATVQLAAKYLLYKALGDAMQVILARLVIGSSERNVGSYCLFTVDSVVAAKCIELQIPVCRQCSTSEYTKEKADLGQSFYYAPSLTPAQRSMLEFDMLRTDIYQSNDKVLRQIAHLLALIPTGAIVKMGAIEVDLTDKRGELESLFRLLYSAISTVNMGLPIYRALFPNVREIECLRANMVCEVDSTNTITIFRTNSLFHITYRDHHTRLGLSADPIYGNELTAIVLAFQQDPAKRGKIQRGGQRGGAWVTGENVPRNFMKEYYEIIIHIVDRIYRELGQAGAQAQLLAMYNEDQPNAEFVFDIAYHFIISTAAYFNYIGFSCTDEETLYEIVLRFMTGGIELSFQEFTRFFYSLRKPQILLQNNRDIAQATEEYNNPVIILDESEDKLLKYLTAHPAQKQAILTAIAHAGTVPAPKLDILNKSYLRSLGLTRQTAKVVKPQVAKLQTKKTYASNRFRGGARKHSSRRSNPLGNSSYRSKRSTVKRVRSPRLKTRKMRRRAVSHI